MQSLLRQLPSCSVPRPLTSASASTSGRTPACSATVCPRHHQQQHHQRQQQQPWLPQQQQQQQQQQQRRGGRLVVRITGTRDEYDIDGITDPEEIWGEEADNEFIEVEKMPVFDPARLGPRVFNDAEDEKESKEISIQDTAYWFADSNGGELPRSYWQKQVEYEEPKMIDDLLPCPDEEGMPQRLRWRTDLEEGDELVGIVTDLWLWHGALIDVLADVKGLLPIQQLEWNAVQDELMPGTQVLVRVHKISEFPKYRFPIQLELLEPAHLAGSIIAPGDYQMPANLGWCYDQGWDIHQVAAQLGRPYEPQVVELEPDMADTAATLDYQMGYDAPDGNPYYGDWVTRELEEPGIREQLAKSASRSPGGPASWGI